MSNLIRCLFINQYAGRGEYRSLFEVFARQPMVRLHVLGPAKGYCPYYEKRETIKPYHGSDYDTFTGKVWNSSVSIGGPYITGLLRQMLMFRPQIIHVHAEPYTVLHVQVLLYRNAFLPKSRVYVMAVDNIVAPAPRGSKMERRRNIVHRYSDGIACWSTLSMAAVRNAGFPPGKIHLTHWGVSLERFQPKRNAELRQRLGIENSFVLGFVGKIELQKGLWTVLLALKQLPPEVKFLCLGNGRWETGFLQKVRDFGLQDRVIHISNVPYQEVANHVNAMDALVLPSETTLGVIEQFGRVLPEAMSCGVPVIASDCGALPEVVADAGLIFAERDYVQLASAVRRLATDKNLYQDLSERGRTRAHGYLSFDALVSRLLDIYGISSGCKNSAQQ